MTRATTQDLLIILRDVLANIGQDKIKECYTFNKNPLELMWFETFNDVLDAIATEKRIKGWSRIKKEALIKNDWDKVVLYSKNYTQYGKPSSTLLPFPSTSSG